MHPCAENLLDDIVEIQNTDDEHAPMLISLSIQCWLAEGNSFNALMEALKARNIPHEHEPPMLLIELEHGKCRVPVESI